MAAAEAAGGLMGFWHKLDKKEKIALGVLVVGVAGYALYRKYQSGSSASSSTTGGASQAVDSYGNPLYPTNLSGVYSSVPNVSYTPGGSGTNATTTTTTPTTGTIRAALSTSQYDKQYGGVAVFATPATNAFGGHNVGYIPFGSNIQILGQVQGTPYSDTSGGSSTYYLTPQGYINAQDIKVG